MTKTQTQQAPEPATIEWESIEQYESDFAVQYPRLQWVHGDKRASGFQKTGGLFIAKDQFPNFAGEGFEAAILITREGDEIQGFAASEAKLAVIRVKHQWVHIDGKNIPLAHALCVVDGVPDLLLLSLKGPSKALDFQKVFNQHIAQVVSVANRTKPDNAPSLMPYALWFRLKSGEHISITSKDGKASSTVTPLTFAVPEKIDRDYAVSLWVGHENYKTFAAFWKDTKQWQSAPIWEQREEIAEINGNGEGPAYTGNDGGPATKEQLEHLINLAEAKDVDIAQLLLEYTNGETNNVETLTKVEAREFIKHIAAM